jgi:isocitrate lyase
MLHLRRGARVLRPALARYHHEGALRLTPPSVKAEAAEFAERVAETDAFFSQPRFSSLKRPYTAADIVSKQGSAPVHPPQSAALADKLYATFKRASEAGQPVHTMGAIDPVQMTQMAKHQEVVYVSGWAASSVLTTANNEVGPDLGYVRHEPVWSKRT